MERFIYDKSFDLNRVGCKSLFIFKHRLSVLRLAFVCMFVEHMKSLIGDDLYAALLCRDEAYEIARRELAPLSEL